MNKIMETFRMLTKGGGVTRWKVADPLTVTEITRVPAGWLLTVEGAREKVQLYSNDMPQWETPLNG